VGYSQLLLEEEEDRPLFSASECRDLEGVADAGSQLLRIVNEVQEPAEVAAGDLSRYLARLRDATRAPLTTALGHVETLLEAHGHAASGDDLRRIRAACLRLAELVDAVDGGHILATAANACAAAAGLDAGADVTASGGRILVIDDEESNRALLTRRLRREGHVVMTADTGEAGIAIATAQPVDVILLDVMMPGISGYDVLARLKQDAVLRDIPVLMITAVDGSASVTRCIALGADDYLAKPFDPVVLAARVRAGVTKKRARDFELAYLRGVAKVTEAAAAVESGRFVASTLDAIAARPDALGNLARLFQRMAGEVASRERRLEAQVHELTIDIDERKKAAQVLEITESEYFRDLKARAHHFSVRRAARADRTD